MLFLNILSQGWRSLDPDPQRSWIRISARIEILGWIWIWADPTDSTQFSIDEIVRPNIFCYTVKNIYIYIHVQLDNRKDVPELPP
jgi:hypothetical protein